MSASRLKADDYARLHYAYTDDTDLQIIADELDEKHSAGHLVFLYWPRMIAAAKAAKSFGWFQTTPKKFAHSVYDTSPWPVRESLWLLLAEHGRIKIRQEAIKSPSAKLDVLLTKVEKWSAWTPAERQKLKRYREQIEAGDTPHWTITHLEEICDMSHHSDSGSRDNNPAARDTHTQSAPPVTQNRVEKAPLHFTSLHNTSPTPTEVNDHGAPSAAVADDEHLYEQRRVASKLPPVTANPLDVLGSQIDQSLTDRLAAKLSEILEPLDATRFAGLITGSKIMGHYSDGGGSKRKYDAGTWERATNVVVRKALAGEIRIPNDGPIGFIITRLHEHTEPGSDRAVEQKAFTPGVKRDETAEEIQARFLARANGVAS